jgi:hypothetical protein
MVKSKPGKRLKVWESPRKSTVNHVPDFPEFLRPSIYPKYTGVSTNKFSWCATSPRCHGSDVPRARQELQTCFTTAVSIIVHICPYHFRDVGLIENRVSPNSLVYHGYHGLWLSLLKYGDLGERGQDSQELEQRVMRVMSDQMEDQMSKPPGGPTRNRVLRGIQLYTIGQLIGYVTYVYICHQRPNPQWHPMMCLEIEHPPWNTNIEGENGNKSARFGASIVIDFDGQSAMVWSPLDLLRDSLGVSILQRSN